MKNTIWKKLLCAVMALAMLASMAACGSSSSAAETTEASAEAASEAAVEASAQDEAAPAEEAAADDLAAKYADLAGTTLRVATSGAQAGWSQDDGNNGIEGMDIDVMNYIGEYYGINIEWTVVDASGIWGMLQSGEVDTIANLTTVNDDRLASYWFTNTYAWESYCLVSRTEDGVPETGDLSFWDGKTICTPAGSNPALILEDIIAQEAEEGVTITGLYPESSAVLIQNVVDKTADAALMCTSTCAYKVQDLGYQDTLNIQDIQWKNMPIVYAFNRADENKEIILAINELVAQMHEDGTLTDLSNKWFGMDVTGVPEGEVNTVTTTGDNAWQSYEG